jgi:predicted DNA-binding antitoxin AbrB/MazE fold protein
MKTIIAIYEDGVFRPMEPVHLPDQSRVRVEVGEHEDELRLPMIAESDLLKYRGSIPWPRDAKQLGDLAPFIGTLASSPVNPVKWQRDLRDEEWS